MLPLTLAATLLLAAGPYDSAKAEIERRRAALAAQWAVAETAADRLALRADARAAAFDAIVHRLLPEWFGTPWAFEGTTQTPRQGTIACGYLVSTVLRDAGLRVERVRLAQQASAAIVETLSGSENVEIYRGLDPSELIRRLKLRGDGLYALGLDFHVGFLVLDGERADLCHASYLPPAIATCEPAATSPAIVSNTHVVGPILHDRRVEDWLTGSPIATASSGRPKRRCCPSPGAATSPSR